MSLKSLIAAPPSGRARPLLLDDTEYSTAVIRQGAPIPWTDTTLAAGHFGQVRGLLDPDALWIDVGRLYTAHVEARPELVQAMSARSRTGYPLRTLLSDNDALATSVEMLTTVAKTARRQLILHIPSPASWLAGAHAAAGNPLDEVDADRADSASMYIAEWAGRLGSLPVALVLLDGRTAGIPETLATYTALANVASHFDWSLGLWDGDGIHTAPGDPGIGVIPPEYWITGAAEIPPGADILVGSIPAAAPPERVLDQLEHLN